MPKNHCAALKADIGKAKNKHSRGKALAKYVKACKPRRHRGRRRRH